MSTFLTIIIKVILILITLVVAMMAIYSYKTQHSQIPTEQRTLIPCPTTPNCVSTQAKNKEQRIELMPLYDKDPETSWKYMVEAIDSTGGQFLVKDYPYAHAVYSSMIFRFKDDIQFQVTPDAIEFRSASRAGKSDIGKNRKRAEEIRSIYISNSKQ